MQQRQPTEKPLRVSHNIPNKVKIAIVRSVLWLGGGISTVKAPCKVCVILQLKRGIDLDSNESALL